VDDGELVHGLDQAGRVELVDAAAVAPGEASGALPGLDQQRLDALGPASVDERLEVPGGLLEGDVGGGAHGVRG
jgi:hypothetical protein